MTLFLLRQSGIAHLNAHAIESADLESELILQHIFNYSKTQLLLHLNDPVTSEQKKQFFKQIQKRATGRPLAYVLGEWSFRNQRYLTPPGVLIPRPETEELVEYVIQLIHQNTLNTAQTRILDIGCGSGIIGIELAKTFPAIEVHAWDISQKAIRAASSNKTLHQAHNLTLHHGNFFIDPLLPSFLNTSRPTIIVSNPPYIPQKTIPTLDRSVYRYEPKRALSGGISGLAFYKRFFKIFHLPHFIQCYEIGIHQSAQLKPLLKNLKNCRHAIYPDINQIDRILSIAMDQKFKL